MDATSSIQSLHTPVKLIHAQKPFDHLFLFFEKINENIDIDFGTDEKRDQTITQLEDILLCLVKRRWMNEISLAQHHLSLRQTGNDVDIVIGEESKLLHNISLEEITQNLILNLIIDTSHPLISEDVVDDVLDLVLTHAQNPDELDQNYPFYELVINHIFNCIGIYPQRLILRAAEIAMRDLYDEWIQPLTDIAHDIMELGASNPKLMVSAAIYIACNFSSFDQKTWENVVKHFCANKHAYPEAFVPTVTCIFILLNLDFFKRLMTDTKGLICLYKDHGKRAILKDFIKLLQTVIKEDRHDFFTQKKYSDSRIVITTKVSLSKLWSLPQFWENFEESLIDLESTIPKPICNAILDNAEHSAISWFRTHSYTKHHEKEH